MNKHGSKWIRRSTRLAVYLRDGFRCQYCGKDLHRAKPRDLTVDHLVPRVLGGTNSARNLVTACRRCNDSKADQHYLEFCTAEKVVALRQHTLTPLPVDLARELLGEGHYSDVIQTLRRNWRRRRDILSRVQGPPSTS